VIVSDIAPKQKDGQAIVDEINSVGDAWRHFGPSLCLTRLFARSTWTTILLCSTRNHFLDTSQTYGPGNAMWVAIDVTKEGDWEAGIAKIEAEMGPLDVCCNKWVEAFLSAWSLQGVDQ
jgi:hypothetical protein